MRERERERERPEDVDGHADGAERDEGEGHDDEVEHVPPVRDEDPGSRRVTASHGPPWPPRCCSKAVHTRVMAITAITAITAVMAFGKWRGCDRHNTVAPYVMTAWPNQVREG